MATLTTYTSNLARSFSDSATATHLVHLAIRKSKKGKKGKSKIKGGSIAGIVIAAVVIILVILIIALILRRRKQRKIQAQPQAQEVRV